MKAYYADTPLTFHHESLWHQCVVSCQTYADLPMFGTKKSGVYEWITYREFFALVTKMRAGLSSLGVGKDDKVAIIAPNGVEWAVTAYAAFGLGAVIVPMYPNQHEEEWAFIVGDSDAKVLLYHSHALDPAIARIRESSPLLQHVVCVEGDKATKGSYKSLLQYGSQHPVPPSPAGLDDLFGLIYTSGTTAQPKGVMLTHRNMLANVETINLKYDFGPGDVTLSFLPWAHIFGQGAELHVLLARGFSTAFAENSQTIMSDLQIVKPTIIISVPKVFNKIYTTIQSNIHSRPLPLRLLFSAGMRAAALRGEGTSRGFVMRLVHTVADRLIFTKVRAKLGGRLRYAISGAAALDIKVARFIANIGIRVYEGYGLTETSPMIAANNIHHMRLGSVGTLIPGSHVTLDTSVYPDSVDEGEIIAYGPMVMRGYYKRPADNEQAFTPDGGLHTGDIGRFDKDGFLYITGRLKEQYKLLNGKYVIPAPLEEKLKLSRFIDNAFVYGEGRTQNVCIISVNREAITSFAAQKGLYDPLEQMIKHPEITTLISKEIHRYNKSFKSFERIGGFALVADEWTTDNDMLTQTLKLKRRQIYPRYRKLIDSLYDPTTSHVLPNPLLQVETRDPEYMVGSGAK